MSRSGSTVSDATLGSAGPPDGAVELPRRGSRLLSPMVVITGWVTLSFCLFVLRWSELFPTVSTDGALFLAVVAGGFLVLGLSFTPQAASRTRDERPTSGVPVLVIVVYMLAASALVGGPPAWLILTGKPYDIYSFGIPFLHVGMLAFSGYYSVRLMSRFIVERRRVLLVHFFVVLACLGLMASRSAVSFVVFACIFLFIRRKGLSAKGLVVLGVATVAFLFAFGLFGDQRLAFQVSAATGNQVAGDAILNYAHASPTFLALGIPSTLMWAYLYMSSPIANLMSAFEYAQGSFCGPRCDFQGLLVHGLMPDMFGARVAEALNVEKFDKSVFLVAPDLTASTVFGSAVGYAGLAGALIVAGVLALITVLVMARLRESDIHESGVAILASMLFFCFFENMISFSPMSLQLVLVVLLARPRATRPHG